MDQHHQSLVDRARRAGRREGGVPCAACPAVAAPTFARLAPSACMHCNALQTPSRRAPTTCPRRHALPPPRSAPASCCRQRRQRPQERSQEARQPVALYAMCRGSKKTRHRGKVPTDNSEIRRESRIPKMPMRRGDAYAVTKNGASVAGRMIGGRYALATCPGHSSTNEREQCMRLCLHACSEYCLWHRHGTLHSGSTQHARGGRLGGRWHTFGAAARESCVHGRGRSRSMNIAISSRPDLGECHSERPNFLGREIDL